MNLNFGVILFIEIQISLQLNLEQVEKGNWRRRVIDPQIRKSCQETGTKAAGSLMGRGLRGSP
jgi:hypothetical protein